MVWQAALAALPSILGQAGAGGGGGSRSQSTSSSSSQVSAVVSPSIGVSVGGSLGQTSGGGASGTSAADAFSSIPGTGGGFATGSDPFLGEDIALASAPGAGLFDGLFSNPLMMLALVGGGALLLLNPKGK